MPERFELRAREAVARCLIRRLVVPRVYFAPHWPNETGAAVDVLVIDRNGAGDVHVIEIKRTAKDAIATIPSLLKIDAPYRWIAFRAGTEDRKTALSLLSEAALYPKDSAGKIGVIEVVESMGGLGANVKITAERFPGRYYDLATRFAETHDADIEYR